MKKKTLETPRGYLSYSQASLWQRSPKQYAALYFDARDELRHSNAAMNYGKLIADALEKGEQTGDLLSDAAMLLLPKYDVADVEFRAELKTPAGSIEILAKPDSLDNETKDFREFKTGKTKWTQDKAQNHLQMHWYATVIYLKYGIIPRASLVWIETETTEVELNGQSVKNVQPTGKIEEFSVVFTMTDILRTMALMGTVAQEIAIAWSAHEVNPEIANF